MRARGLIASVFLACLTTGARADDAGARAYREGDYVRSAAILKREAEAGDAAAQAMLGYQYQYGRGVPKSYEEAARWYACAAEQGEPTAQFFLGQLYDRGQGVAENPVEAEMWLDLAAAHAPPDRRDYWASMRDIVADKMSIDELTEARRRAVGWLPSFACAGRSEVQVLELPTHKNRR